MTRLLSSERRKMSATASALAAKATTIPVMTMACGTGSKRKPAAAPRDNAEDEENAASHQVKGEQFAQRMGMENEPIEPKTNQSRADQSREN